MERIGLKSAAHATFICFVWATNLLALKVLFEGMTPVFASAMRFAAATAGLLAWAALRRIPVKAPREHLGGLFVIGLLGASIFVFFSNGLDRTTVQRASILIYSHPIHCALLAHFTLVGDRLTARKGSGLLIAFAGVALVFAQGVAAGGAAHLEGDALVLAGAVCWAGFTVYSKKLMAVVDPLVVILYEVGIGAPILFLASAALGEKMIIGVTPRVIFALLYAGLFSTAFTFVWWNLLLKRHSATLLSSFVFLCPIFGVFLGGIFLNEGFDVKILLALALVAAGIRIVNSPGKKLIRDG